MDTEDADGPEVAKIGSDAIPQVVSNNVSSDGSPLGFRARPLDYGPDNTRPKPLDVPGRRGSFILSLVAVLFFGFPPVCLLLSAAAGILAVRALRLTEKGQEGRWMPIAAVVIALVGALWGAGLTLYLLLSSG